MENELVIHLENATIYHRPNRNDPSGHKRGNVVLTDINISIYEGELVYLIGKVGSGKSSLLKTLYGELPLAEGRGWIAGFDIRNIKKRDIPYLRRQIGMVFQDFQLLGDRNVWENLRFVLYATGWKNEGAIRRRIEEVLELVDLKHKIYKKPHELSGGEQQRLAIGRAFLNHPDIMLVDEPTGNLDPKTAEDIMSLFVEITQMGCSVLIATHDISVIEKYPSRTLRFDSGYISEIDIVSILGIS